MLVLGCVQPLWVKLIWMVSLWPLQHQPLPVRAPLRVSVVITTGDNEIIVREVTRLWDYMGRGPYPTIIAMEPGPLDLAHGLRLLPNEISPRLSLPDILLISSAAALDDLFFAFMRRCLRSHIKVCVVGPDFPPLLCDFPLEPGYVIERIDPKDVFLRLRGEFLSSAAKENPANLLEAPR